MRVLHVKYLPPVQFVTIPVRIAAFLICSLKRNLNRI